MSSKRVTAICTIWSILALAGCASPSLRVESNPEGADVLVARDGALPLKLGKTPYSITQEVAPDLFSENFKVTVAKSGFLSESLFVPKTIMSSAGRWLVTLKEPNQVQEVRDTGETANAVAQGVAEAQQRFFQRNYTAAQKILEDLAAKYPNSSVIQDLLGNVFYIQKDSARALSAYKRSYELKPNSPQTARMIEKLSQIQGARNGAGGSP